MALLVEPMLSWAVPGCRPSAPWTWSRQEFTTQAQTISIYAADGLIRSRSILNSASGVVNRDAPQSKQINTFGSKRTPGSSTETGCARCDERKTKVNP